jgi:RHS repeat-associated protein
MIASSRLIPLDMTNVTWLTTCYRYDDLGRQTATWQTNLAAKVGLPATRTAYDPLGRVIARVDQLGNTTTTTYSPDGRTVSVQHPNTSTTTYIRSPFGDTLSITGSAVTPEFHTYGILSDGTRWTKTVQGETASSPRFTKRYENMLGQVVKEERSGFKGAVLTIDNTYDGHGRIVRSSEDYNPTTEYVYDTTGERILTIKLVDGQWRRNEFIGAYGIIDGKVWHSQSNIVSCSDERIVPITSSSSIQLSGLSGGCLWVMRVSNQREQTTKVWMGMTNLYMAIYQCIPSATTKAITQSRYGISLMDVSVSAVTNYYAYDYLGRAITHTDGRGNTRYTEYNSVGQNAASIDALGNRTAYTYDQFGNLTSVINPLGNAIVYEYDIRGRKIYEGGATYPVRYTYDVFGNKTTMMTYRDESKGRDSGDVTTWLYDEASGAMTNKVYADGKGPKYNYTTDGKLAQRIWARGIATDYSYDGWGNLTNTIYSDNTPTISLKYDALGRQTEAHDAAGVTTFLYDSYGSLTNETVVGVAGTNTIIRYWDEFGRTAGYALNGTRQTTICYEPDKGRISTMETFPAHSPTPTQNSNYFKWNYLPGSNLKSSLIYPNGFTASWAYDANNQLIQVCNATPTNVISQYDYTYDAAGRRVSCTQSGSAVWHEDVILYAYNSRSELTNAVANVDTAYRYSYQYDDIGNRMVSNETGSNVLYTANELNQYVGIDNFAPEYDVDGNQVLIHSLTGIWSVIYNGENRPIRWRQNDKDVLMQYDSLGRRVAKNDKVFVYNNYLQIADNGHNAYIWDPTEDVHTKPLMLGIVNGGMVNNSFFFIHDGSECVVDICSGNSALIEHHKYTPFGMVKLPATENSFLFSSEYYDSEMRLSYFNYRHYSSLYGRWLTTDPCAEISFQQNKFESNTNHCYNQKNLYSFVQNSPVFLRDIRGLMFECDSCSDLKCQKLCDRKIADAGFSGGWYRCRQVTIWPFDWHGCKCTGKCILEMEHRPSSRYERYTCMYKCGTANHPSLMSWEPCKPYAEWGL